MATPVLHHFETILLRDRSASDRAQVPLASTDVAFYRQGATVSGSATVQIDPGQTKDVEVFDPGELMSPEYLEEPDQVWAGASGPQLEVAGVGSLPAPFPGPTTVQLTNSNWMTVWVQPGTRLLLLTRPPGLYSTPTPVNPLPSNVVESDVGGRVTVYISQQRFDYVVLEEAEPRLYVDVRGGARPNPSWIDIREEIDLQKAIDALPRSQGGEIFLATGLYTVNGPVRVRGPNVSIRGVGASTIIKAASPNFTMIHVERDLAWDPNLVPTNFRLRDVLLQGAGVGSGTGLLIKGAEASHLENVSIVGTGLQGFHFDGVSLLVAVNCLLNYSNGLGGRISGGKSVRLIACRFTNGVGRATVVDSAATAVTFYFCQWESNAGGPGYSEANSLDVLSATQLQVLYCYFEHAFTTPASAEQFVRIAGGDDAIVEGCWYQGRVVTYKPKRAVLFAGSKRCRFANNGAENLMSELVRFDTGCDDCVELGNTEGTVAARIAVEGKRVFSLSRGGVTLYRYTDATKPNAASVLPGSMIWVEDTKTLLVSNGDNWIAQ